MANTMFNNNQNNLLGNFKQFVENVQKSGKTPQQLLDEIMSSGKYTKADLDKAKTMANMFAKFIK